MPASEARGTHIFMMRHAITVWNLAGRIQGHHDAPLAPDGERQIVAWRAALEGWGLDRIYSSDLARAQTTARRLNQTRGLPLAEEPRLREQDWGEWTGRVQRRLKQEDSAAYKRQTRRGWQFRPPGGESQLEVLERAAGLTADQAKELLLKAMENDARYEGAKLIKRIENETKEQAELLRKLRVYLLQGFLYSRPLPAAKLTELLEWASPPRRKRQVARDNSAAALSELPPLPPRIFSNGFAEDSTWA